MIDIITTICMKSVYVVSVGKHCKGIRTVGQPASQVWKNTYCCDFLCTVNVINVKIVHDNIYNWVLPVCTIFIDFGLISRSQQYQTAAKKKSVCLIRFKFFRICKV